MAPFVAKLLSRCTDATVGETLIGLLDGPLDKDVFRKLAFPVSPATAAEIRRSGGQHLALAAAKSPSSPEALDVLARDPRVSVRRRVASNRGASEETLERLFRWGYRSDDETERTAFHNPAMSARLAFELHCWAEASDLGSSFDDFAVLAKVRDDPATLIAALKHFAANGSDRSIVDHLRVLTFSFDEYDPDGPVSLLDTFLDGRLHGVVTDGVRSDLVRAYLSGADHSLVGAAGVWHLVESGYEPVKPQPVARLTAEGCRVAWGQSDAYRLWAARSESCPKDLVWREISRESPDPLIVALAFSRFASLEEQGELDELLQACRRADLFEAGRVKYSKVPAKIEQLASAAFAGKAPAPSPQLACEMARFGYGAATQHLLKFMTPTEAAALIDAPDAAFSDRLTGHETWPAAVAFGTLLHPSPAARHVLLHGPGLVAEWSAELRDWHNAAVYEYFLEQFGTDRAAWQFAVTLASDWSGSFAELVAVAAAGTDGATPSAAESPDL